jgi:hypothetical protein
VGDTLPHGRQSNVEFGFEYHGVRGRRGSTKTTTVAGGCPPATVVFNAAIRLG